MCFDDMFDLNGDGSLDIGERALEAEYMLREELGDGDVDWESDPLDDDGDVDDDGDDW